MKPYYEDDAVALRKTVRRGKLSLWILKNAAARGAKQCGVGEHAWAERIFHCDLLVRRRVISKAQNTLQRKRDGAQSITPGWARP